MHRLILGLISLAMIGAGLWLGQKRMEPYQQTSTQIENGFFQHKVLNPQGKEISLSFWKNRAVLVNFWSKDCKPCLEEMPELDQLAKDWANEIEVIGISLDKVEQMNQFLEKTPVSYPVFSAGSKGIELAKALGNSKDAVPYTVIFDQKSEIIWQKLGRVDAEALSLWKQQFVK